jgi:hypothetical protein
LDNDDLPFSATGLNVSEGLGDFGEGIGFVDDDPKVALFDQVREQSQIAPARMHE